MERKYYVVDSIKGGCGKTTFAIMLAQFLESQNEKRGMNEHTCLLDFDFMGTGLINIFLSMDEQRNFEENYFYITDKIRNFDCESRKYIYRCTVAGNPFYIGFGDPDYRKKNRFSLSSRSNYVPVTNYSIFRNGIKNILKNEGTDELEAQVSGTVSSVVMDMSPGMDAYSEVVKESMFDRIHSSFLGDRPKTWYFLMMGMDSGHVAAARNYFKEFITNDTKTPHKIFIVLNDPMQMALKLKRDKGEPEVQTYSATMEEFKKEIKSLKEDYRKRISFLVMQHFDTYAVTTHQRIPLCQCLDGADKVFLPCAFRFWAPWEASEMQEIPGGMNEREEFLKCLTG